MRLLLEEIIVGSLLHASLRLVLGPETVLKDESKEHDKASYNCCNTHVTKIILDLFFEVH